VVLVHVSLYGHPPPHILDRIVGNLDKLADWFIEENFSYIRVFGCSVPPHALPIFLLDRLVCQEVSYQIVMGGMSKELKETPKKDQHASFLSFQRHRKNSFSKILQGESIAAPSAHKSIPTGFETWNSGKHDIEENIKSFEVLNKKLEASLSIPLGAQATARLEAFLKKG
jgi:hypothetical protein